VKPGSEETVGQIVPDYELLRRIGAGAYGEVWLARSKATGVLRAVKIVWRSRFADDRPFQREFEGIQRFEQISREHPSQLALFHIGRNEAEGYFYYVMELAEPVVNPKSEIRSPKSGTTLGEAAVRESDAYVPHTLRADLANGRLPAARVLEIGQALTEALGHLHRNGLVHRDVKPSNVIFVNGRPKLADIGLVTDASDQCSIVGTEGYLPPEGPGTPQADIFALGKVLYEAATGLDRREFPDLPPDIRAWPEAKRVFEINEVILKACALDLQQRYQNCEEMQADLRLLERGKSVKQKRTRQRYWAMGKRIGAGLGIAAAIAGLIFAAWPRQSRRSEPSNDGPDSTNLEANALCDKAMYILRGDNYAELLAAYSNFNAAITLDPNFARPYVGLMELRSREDVNVPGMPPETTGEFREIARRLEQLAPDLAATHCVKSMVLCSDWRLAESMQEALEATKADPGYEYGHTTYATMLICLGRPEEARKELEMSRKIAPSKTIVYRFFGQMEFAERHYPEAIRWFKTAIEWEPHHWASYQYMGQAYEALGDYANAVGDYTNALGDYTNGLDCIEKSDLLLGADEAKTKAAYDGVRATLARHGIKGYWEDQWLGTMKYPDRDFYYKAIIRMELGDTNGALDWLEKEYQNRANWDVEPPFRLLLFDQYWDGLHDNPRFRKFLVELNYTQVMPPAKK
jgi:serine/threonine protein kinase